MTVAQLLEKFEDIFTPHTPEEVEKRTPEWNVNFFERGIKPGKWIKSLKVKAISIIEVINAVADMLGIQAKRFIILQPKPSEWEKWHIDLTEEDNVRDNKGRLMVGKYVITLHESNR